MKRSSKKTIPVHVTIPVRLLEDLDETLDYKQSRSRIISKLIDAYLDGSEIPVSAMSATQLIAAAMAQIEPNSTEHIMLKTVYDIISGLS